MAIIAQFDTDPTLITIKDKHHAWHTPGGAHGYPPRQFASCSAGSGHEFLQFHKDLVNQVIAWNNIHHAASAADLAAWSAVPSELKLPETGWPDPGFSGCGFSSNLASAEARIATNLPPFASDDELGIFIENTIHNWIHGAVAASSILNLPAAEKDIIAHFHSVQSTYFYKIHGLVQHWWDHWLHPKSHLKEIIDAAGTKITIKDVIDTKPRIKDVVDAKPVVADTKAAFKEVLDGGGPKGIKDKEKDIFENKQVVEVSDPFQNAVDPAVLKNMVDEIARLQTAAGVKKSHFIQPFMRPMVGEGITKKEQTNKKKEK